MAPTEPTSDPSILSAHVGGDGTPFRHHWNLVAGAGRANEGLRADWQRQLREVIEVQGFRYLRFHGLFHDDMFVYREDESGQVAPSFQYMDVLFDALLESGIRPFVEFGFMPSEIAVHTATGFWWRANGSPPTDFDKWEQLVLRTVEHWRDRYGIDEIRTWYFEVWNEPNLAPFFRGTRAEYLEMYKRAARAVKSVDTALRVGGPATSNFVPDARFDGETEDTSQHAMVLAAEDLSALEWKPVWLAEFLAFTEQESLPVDFISVHPYPTDWALDGHGQGAKLTRDVNATARDLRLLRTLVNESHYPDAEIHLTEWSSSSSSRDHTHDHLQAGTFVLKANLDTIGLVDSLAYWAFTDIFEEEGGGQEPFHGGFGLLTHHGIPKPTYHAYRFLAELGDELLATTDVGALTRRSEDGKLVGALFHYPAEVTLTVPASIDSRDIARATLATGTPRAVSVRIDGLAPDARFRLEVVDESSGNAIAAWTDRGSPANLSRADQAAIDESARALRVEEYAASEGALTLDITLQPWSFALLTQL
ncbi:beta-xylosidase [Salinibacterium sp. G-O1]|uniref:GH39 family glycosyl hydrolase n=1 Tax=Salinibacterium sp. G-O1 TaxID=3046208 RepID=UPI0024B8872A|nr:beta-xylosidase [Salinibacterium sp. G-O1]MDJ0334059.1 beta-xylosidase [Salinibacterium sp. G-O1]